MILPDQVNLAEVAYYQHLLDEEMERQTRIVKARALDDGYYDEDLANQTMKFLVGGEANEIEGINLMSIVLRTILRRIDVAGLSAEDETLQEWANGVWDANHMDTKQSDINRGAERDGEYFVIVDYDRNAPGRGKKAKIRACLSSTCMSATPRPKRPMVLKSVPTVAAKRITVTTTLTNRWK